MAMNSKDKKSRGISYATIKKNTKLTSFSEIKDYIVSKAISKELPELKQKKTNYRDTTLADF